MIAGPATTALESKVPSTSLLVTKTYDWPETPSGILKLAELPVRTLVFVGTVLYGL